MQGLGRFSGQLFQRQQAHGRSGGFVSIGIILSLVGAMLATMLGAGAFIDAFNVADGNTWLWSSKPGTASRVNSNSGRVDMRQPLVDARGHRVRITQNDKYLILHDLDTGRVTSVDLTKMGFTGSLNVGTESDISVVLHGDKAVVVDRTKGLVRVMDPVTLRAAQHVLRLPPPIVGGAFDSDGALWLGVPSQGTLVAAKVTEKAVRAQRSIAVAEPGADLVLTALDHGGLAVDRTKDTVTVVDADGERSLRVDASLADAEVPERTAGGLAAITLAEERSVMVLKLKGEKLRASQFRLPATVEPGTAVAYAGRIYVPDEKQSTVHVYSGSGKRIDHLEMNSGKGPLELEVREGKLFINAPDSSNARVVDEDGTSQEINKYREDVTGGSGVNSRVMPAPRPGDDDSSQGDGEEQGPPGPPVPVTAVAGDEKVNLSWGGAALNGAAISEYRITWDGGSREMRGRRSAEIGGLRNGTPYTFKVVAVNKFGTGPPAFSEPVTPTDRVPGQPQNVKAVAAPDESGARVTWNAVSGARDYVVTTLQNGQQSTVAPVTVSGNEAVIRGLTYGEPYQFTVVARNDSGAGSEPSEPSNEVRPYAAPSPPQNPRAQGTGANEVTVYWDPAAPNGDPISKYVVTPSAGNPVTVGGGARKAVVGGLPTGQTVTFEITAHNKAGGGQPATTSAKVGRAPTITIGSTPGDYQSITVNFSVDGHGMAVRNCTAKVEGGSAHTGNCSRITVKGLYPGRSYTVIVNATNDIGTSQERKGASTKRLLGTITCKNGPSGDQRTYCDKGITVYDGPSQTSGAAYRAFDGQRKEAVCKRIDPYPPGDDRAIKTAYVYNNNKSSRWWIKLPDGKWAPHIWLNLDAGDGDTANLAILPKC